MASATWKNRSVDPNTGAISLVVGFSGVHLVPLDEEGRSFIAIDSGPDEEAKAISELLGEFGRSLNDIEAVYLTHEHWDHYLGASALTHAAVFASPIATIAMQAEDQPKPVNHEPVSPILIDNQMKHIYGDVIVEALATPGHTAGGMSYLVTTALGETLFTGDVFDVGKNGEVQLPPKPVTQDMDLARKTIKRVGKFVSNKPGLILRSGHSVAISAEAYTASISSW